MYTDFFCSLECLAKCVPLFSLEVTMVPATLWTGSNVDEKLDFRMQ